MRCRKPLRSYQGSGSKPRQGGEENAGESEKKEEEEAVAEAQGTGAGPAVEEAESSETATQCLKNLVGGWLQFDTDIDISASISQRGK